MPSPKAGRGAPSLTQRFLQAILRKWRYHTQNKLQQKNTTHLALQIIYKLPRGQLDPLGAAHVSNGTEMAQSPGDSNS